MGSLFAPITGTMLVGYCYQFKCVDVPALYQRHGIYRYFRGFNISACLLAPAAFLTGLFMPEYWVPAVFLMFAAAFFYWLLNPVKKRVS